MADAYEQRRRRSDRHQAPASRPFPKAGRENGHGITFSFPDGQEPTWTFSLSDGTSKAIPFGFGNRIPTSTPLSGPRQQQISAPRPTQTAECGPAPAMTEANRDATVKWLACQNAANKPTEVPCPSNPQKTCSVLQARLEIEEAQLRAGTTTTLHGVSVVLGAMVCAHFDQVQFMFDVYVNY